MPVMARASVDLPEAETPITPSAWPGSSVRSRPRRLGLLCSGGTMVSACTSSRPRGRGRAVGSSCSGVVSSSFCRFAQPCRARSTSGQPPIACSTGASARPIRIEPAIIAPALISPSSTT